MIALRLPTAIRPIEADRPEIGFTAHVNVIHDLLHWKATGTILGANPRLDCAACHGSALDGWHMVSREFRQPTPKESARRAWLSALLENLQAERRQLLHELATVERYLKETESELQRITRLK